MSLSYRKARTRAGTDRLPSGQARSPGWAASEPPVIDISGPAERGADVIELFPDQKPPGKLRALRRDFGGSEAGMATAEYAIATLAAVGFAGLLVVILRSDQVRGFLLSIIEQALSF